MKKDKNHSQLLSRNALYVRQSAGDPNPLRPASSFPDEFFEGVRAGRSLLSKSKYRVDAGGMPAVRAREGNFLFLRMKKTAHRAAMPRAPSPATLNNASSGNRLNP
jgi:hypothetical protein